MRRVILLISFIVFPITMNCFSPYLVVDAAFHGILNGSLVVFASMFVGSLVLGRPWCGWGCPAARSMENVGCVLRGTCVDGCSPRVIRYFFSAGRLRETP